MTVKLILLLAAFLPLVATVSAKAGGRGFQNHTPRSWLSDQEGWRARANAAQANSFEALPFFYAAFLFAFFSQADVQFLVSLGFIWLALRLFYIGLYVKNMATPRSIVWGLALIVNIWILFI